MIRNVTLVTRNSATHDVLSRMLRLQIEHLTFSGFTNIVIIIIFLVIILVLLPLIIMISYVTLMTDHHYFQFHNLLLTQKDFLKQFLCLSWSSIIFQSWMLFCKIFPPILYPGLFSMLWRRKTPKNLHKFPFMRHLSLWETLILELMFHIL